MITSEVGIASAALTHIGADPIASFDDAGRTDAAVMKERYHALRDRLLRSYPWNFAMRFAGLPGEALDAATHAGYTHRCALPAGGSPGGYCLRVWRVQGDNDPRWSVSGRYLLVDRDPPARILYVARVEDVGTFDPLFSEILALDLAMACAPRLGSSEMRKRAGQLQAARRELWREARRSDAMEQSADQLYTADRGGWLAARRPL